MHKHKIVLTMALAAALSACAGQSATRGEASGNVSKADVDQAIAHAQAEIKKAAKMDALWSNTEGYVKQAKAAESAGDNAKALKLANQAAKDAQVAQAQAESQKNAHPYYE